MKPIAITTLQEYSKTQLGVTLNDKPRKLVETWGWRKKDTILISRHGATLVIEKISKQNAADLVKALLASEPQTPQEQPEPAKGKHEGKQ